MRYFLVAMLAGLLGVLPALAASGTPTINWVNARCGAYGKPGSVRAPPGYIAGYEKCANVRTQWLATNPVPTPGVNEAVVMTDAEFQAYLQANY